MQPTLEHFSHLSSFLSVFLSFKKRVELLLPMLPPSSPLITAIVIIIMIITTIICHADRQVAMSLKLGICGTAARASQSVRASQNSPDQSVSRVSDRPGRPGRPEASVIITQLCAQTTYIRMCLWLMALIIGLPRSAHCSLQPGYLSHCIATALPESISSLSISSLSPLPCDGQRVNTLLLLGMTMTIDGRGQWRGERWQWSLQCVCVCSIGQLSGQCEQTQRVSDWQRRRTENKKKETTESSRTQRRRRQNSLTLPDTGILVFHLNYLGIFFH